MSELSDFIKTEIQKNNLLCRQHLIYENTYKNRLKNSDRLKHLKCFYFMVLKDLYSKIKYDQYIKNKENYKLNEPEFIEPFLSQFENMFKDDTYTFLFSVNSIKYLCNYISSDNIYEFCYIFLKLIKDPFMELTFDKWIIKNSKKNIIEQLKQKTEIELSDEIKYIYTLIKHVYNELYDYSLCYEIK